MVDVADLSAQLGGGLSRLGIEPVAALTEPLLAYLDLLQHWNRAYNLTAIREPGEMVARHLLDSLAIAPLLPTCATRLIDVGSGAGLPGIPLAVLYPEREVHLLDSNGKKARFLFQAKTTLGLDNMEVHHTRAETFTPDNPFDAVLSRAFASLVDMVGYCAHLCGPKGIMYAMKGEWPAMEIAALPDNVTVLESHKLEVPGVKGERYLLELAAGQLARG
jgi:16S rRNA (guanine527-N7)-methyltransferase